MHYINTATNIRFNAAKLCKVNLFETPQMFCDIYCLEPGQLQKVHSHADATKFYYVIDGTATITIGSQSRDVGPGTLAWAAPGEPHGVINRSNERVVLLVAMGPNPNVADS